MSNSKKYADVVREDKDTHFCRDFVKSYVLKSDNCAGIFCSLNTWNNRQTSWTEYHMAVGITPDWQKVRIQNESKNHNRR